MRLLHLTHALLFLLFAVSAVVLGVQSRAPVVAVAFALVLATRGMRSLVLIRGRRRSAGAEIVDRRVWHPVAMAYLAAAGAFFVSVLVGETWWSVLGMAWCVSLAVVWLHVGKRSAQAGNAG